MIDPKQESDMKDPIMLEAEIQTLTYELNNARAEIIKYQRMYEDNALDYRVMLSMLQHFVVIAVERGEHDMIRDAIDFVYYDTTAEYEQIGEIVDRLGICDADEYCKKEYIVSLTLPVTISVAVQAFDENDATEAAQNEADSRGIDDFHMEYDVFDADVYAEEA